jgi:hypothetical protein
VVVEVSKELACFAALRDRLPGIWERGGHLCGCRGEQGACSIHCYCSLGHGRHLSQLQWPGVAFAYSIDLIYCLLNSLLARKQTSVPMPRTRMLNERGACPAYTIAAIGSGVCGQNRVSRICEDIARREDIAQNLVQVLKPTAEDKDAVVPGLLAAGEAACASVHGANRLGANSLLDIVVFGRACANTVAELVKPGSPADTLPANAGEEGISRLERFRTAAGSQPAAQIRNRMQKVMQKDAAVFRTQVRWSCTTLCALLVLLWATTCCTIEIEVLPTTSV